jgi:nitroreductase/NAD-dependent dihydropyrimidine dehydrogenase PreA subunit
MVSFHVDEFKCARDGICVTECPARLIELRADSGLPSWVAGAEGLCVNCGHCLAACPKGAIALGTMPTERCPPVQKDLFFSPAQVEHQLCARRSVRNYQSKPVPREVLTQLIETARFAPSGGNRQPVEWLIVYDSDRVRELARHAVDWVRSILQTSNLNPLFARTVDFYDRGEDIMITGNAPHLILAVAPKASGAVFECNIALTYLALSAPAYGLGTCFGGVLRMALGNWSPMRRALGLAEGQECLGAMMIGYPKHEYRRIPTRNEAKVTWL